MHGAFGTLEKRKVMDQLYVGIYFFISSLSVEVNCRVGRRETSAILSNVSTTKLGGGINSCKTVSTALSGPGVLSFNNNELGVGGDDCGFLLHFSGPRIGSNYVFGFFSRRSGPLDSRSKLFFVLPVKVTSQYSLLFALSELVAELDTPTVCYNPTAMD